MPEENTAVPAPTKTTLEIEAFSLSDKMEIRTPDTEKTATKAGPARICK